MIKVLIVEDEVPTALSIAMLVGRHPSFSVAATTINGKQALEFLRNNKVDLIITDIQMPLMDGLQLLEVVQREFPHCMTVMLTGFSYFEYARTALQLRAFDYLLKPIDDRAFLKMLNHAEEAWNAQRRAQTRAMLENALSGRGANETTDTYAVLLAVANAAFWEQTDRMPDMMQDSYVFRGARDTERIFVLENSNWSMEQLEQFHRQFHHRLDLIGTTNRVPPAALSQTVERLRTDLLQQAKLFQSNLLCINSEQAPVSYSDMPLGEMHPEQAIEAIRTRNDRDLKKCLTQMWQISERCGFRWMDWEVYLAAILMDSQICQRMTADRLYRSKEKLLDILRTADDPEACTMQLTDMLLSLLRNTTSRKEINEIVEEIARYLNANYHMPITTEDLAKRYGFVPQYLNRIFKKQKGICPAEYLLNLRIQQARHMLETTPGILVKDVAASVGYSNHHYFSKVFYRATGLWPTEVQPLHERASERASKHSK